MMSPTAIFVIVCLALVAAAYFVIVSLEHLGVGGYQSPELRSPERHKELR